MAKARDLAALAGLAGLAYAMRNKGDSSGMTGAQNDTLANVNRVSKMSEDSDTLARMNREKTPGQGAVDDANAGVLNALSAPKAAPKAAPNDKAPSQGVLPPKSLTPEAKPKPKPKPRGMTAKQNDMLATANRNRLTDEKMSRGRRMASGGMTASRRADGIATKGKTRGKIC